MCFSFRRTRSSRAKMRLFGLPDKVVRSGCAPWSNVAKTTAASLGKRRTIMQAGLLNDKWVLITGGTGSFGNEVVVTVAGQPIDVNALNRPVRIDGIPIAENCAEVPILRDLHVVQEYSSDAQAHCRRAKDCGAIPGPRRCACRATRLLCPAPSTPRYSRHCYRPRAPSRRCRIRS